MGKKTVAAFIVILIAVVAGSGCIESLIDLPTVYQTHPVRIRYMLRYGYNISCSGAGEYEIKYLCNKPSVASGNITVAEILYQKDYEHVELVNNSFIRWDIKSSDSSSYELGINIYVDAESLMVSDLNGEKAFSIKQIKLMYPGLVDQYCHPQSMENKTYIDPDHVVVKTVAENIVDGLDTDNSFVVAKMLFIWLKENTRYEKHEEDKALPQPANLTYELRSGDCDDLSYLYISLCRAVGIPARLIRGFLIKEDRNGSVNVFPHAWTEVFVGGNLGDNGWIPVECAGSGGSVKADVHQNFGLEDCFHLRLFVDDGSNESLNISSSGPQVFYEQGMQVDMFSFAMITGYES
ncbi:MAG: hypothetical protein DRN05_03370, partial [Thermoplasmata archaeon]